MFSFSATNSDRPKFDKGKLLPLVIKLGDFLKKAFDHYTEIRIAGSDLDADTLAAFVYLQMASWDPKVGNKDLLDDETKHAAARFVAGVAMKMAKEQ
jgi:hypothetical protein